MLSYYILKSMNLGFAYIQQSTLQKCKKSLWFTSSTFFLFMDLPLWEVIFLITIYDLYFLYINNVCKIIGYI